MVPDSVGSPWDPPAALKGHKGRKGRNFFLAQTVPFDPSVDPWWSLMVPDSVGPPQDPPAASNGHKGLKGRNFFWLKQRLLNAALGQNFFSAQTVPFDLSVNPWWSLIVSGLPGTLQRPQGRKGRQFFFSSNGSF